MKKLTKEQFEYLSQFEDRMVCASKANYCRNVQREDLVQIRSIYEELIGQPHKMQMNCNTCVLHLIKLISEPYFNYKSELENERTEATSEEPKKQKGKRGRQKQTDERIADES